MGFTLPDDSRSIVTLRERPMGLKFKGVGPLTVTQVNKGFHADEVGIKVGWVLTHIDSDDLTEMSEQAARKTVRVKTSRLKLM